MPPKKSSSTPASTPEQASTLAFDQIYHMDCLEGFRQLATNSADIVICDPPYPVNNYSDKKILDDYLKWADQYIAEAFRVVKEDGTVFIFGYSELLSFVRTRLPIPLNNCRWLIWHFTNKNIPTLRFWQRSHESILCCWKKGDRPNFNLDDVREPYTELFMKGAAGRKRVATKGRFSDGTKETVYNAHEKGALPRDTFKIPAIAGQAFQKERVVFPTQRPLELCKRLILSARRELPAETVVVVPFAGSGSECVAAYQLGAKFIGFEIDEAAIGVAAQRLLYADAPDPSPNTSPTGSVASKTLFETRSRPSSGSSSGSASSGAPKNLIIDPNQDYNE